MNKYFTVKKIFIGIGIIGIDLVVYILLGIAMMEYDDFYEDSKGEYLSLESMNAFGKSIFISLNIWNVINISIGVFIIYKVFKYFKTNKQLHE